MNSKRKWARADTTQGTIWKVGTRTGKTQRANRCHASTTRIYREPRYKQWFNGATGWTTKYTEPKNKYLPSGIQNTRTKRLTRISVPNFPDWDWIKRGVHRRRNNQCSCSIYPSWVTAARDFGRNKWPNTTLVMKNPMLPLSREKCDRALPTTG